MRSAADTMAGTEASVAKVKLPRPNKSDAQTGWGPIENVTVAALDFANAHKLPKQHQCFTELAVWLARHAAEARSDSIAAEHGGSTATAMSADAACLSSDQQDGAGDLACPDDDISAEDMQHFQQVAQKLLGLNHNAMAALLQKPWEAEPDKHMARQLWRSIPQPANVPAVCTPHVA